MTDVLSSSNPAERVGVMLRLVAICVRDPHRRSMTSFGQPALSINASDWVLLSASQTEASGRCDRQSAFECEEREPKLRGGTE